MQTIGIVNIDPKFAIDNNSLRRDLIYFDKIMYTMPTGIEKFCSAVPLWQEKYKRKLKEIEHLQKAGLVLEYTDHSLINGKKDIYLTELIIKYKAKALELSQGFTSKNKTAEETFIDFFERYREVGQIETRLHALLLNIQTGNNHIPIIKNNYFNIKDDETYSTCKVVSIILKKIPQISDENDIEKFIEFKKDPDTILKLSRLRDWTLEIGKKNYSEKEIEQKIEYLLMEYSKQIKIHKLKYEFGQTQTFVTTSLEVLENLVKLNFSKVAKTIFDIGTQKLNLLEAEQKLIGKELALIHDLKNENKF